MSNGQPNTESVLVVDVGRILFVTAVDEVPAHRAMVPVFAAGLDGEFEITAGDTTHRIRASIAPADLVREVNGFGRRLAVMPIDPVLAPTSPADPEACVALLDELVVDFTPAVWAKLSTAIGLGATNDSRPAELLEAMRLVRSSSDENVPGDEIARQVGFSLSHLQQLFRVHVGTSIRSYRTWTRFVALARALTDGHSLTAGAAMAGFFDSAHLTRSFSQTFGVPPSFVFGGDIRIHVVAQGQPETDDLYTPRF